jgi:hypothetical protein
VPAVPGAHRGGGPGVCGVVNYTTGEIISDVNRSFAGGRKRGKGKEKENSSASSY